MMNQRGTPEFRGVGEYHTINEGGIISRYSVNSVTINKLHVPNPKESKAQRWGQCEDKNVAKSDVDLRLTC